MRSAYLFIMGLILIYVDGLMIFTTRVALEKDMQQTRDTCISLLGNDARCRRCEVSVRPAHGSDQLEC